MPPRSAWRLEDRLRPLLEGAPALLKRVSGQFEKRVWAGKIVDGHGDLRPANICLTPTPVIFDCLEFSRALRCADVLADVACLCVSLEAAGEEELSQTFQRAYERAHPDCGSRRLMNFYRLYRALVHARLPLRSESLAHTDRPAIETEDAGAVAGRYLSIAARCLVVGRPNLGRDAQTAKMALTKEWRKGWKKVSASIV